MAVSILGGMLGVGDLDTRLINMEQRDIWTAIDEYLARWTADRNAALGFLVSEELTDYQENIKLPMSGEMQKLDRFGRPSERRFEGEYSVAYPLFTVGDAFGYDQVAYAYMTARELQKLTDDMVRANNQSHLMDAMRAIFGNTNYTFTDDRAGDLTIRRLANTDGTTYPPLLGATAVAEDEHYLESGYLASAISDTNQPFKTLRTELTEHGGQTVVAFINSAQRDVVKALSAFVDPPEVGIQPGDDTATSTAVGQTVPGMFVGVCGDSGVYVYEWDAAIPAGYILARNLDMEAPLKRRVHVPESLRGFKLWSEEEMVPIYKRQWIDRYGYGVGNRVSCAVMELANGGSYTVPAKYA